jgi:hypothetical protein
MNFFIDSSSGLLAAAYLEQLKNPANPEADENRRVQVVNLTR